MSRWSPYPWRGPVRCLSGWSEFWPGRTCQLAWTGENARWWLLRLLRGSCSSQAPSRQAGQSSQPKAWPQGQARPASHTNGVAGEPHPFDRYVGYYEFTPFRALTVARAGDRLTVQETGRLKIEVAAHGDQAFVSQVTDETITFTSDAEGRTAALLLGEQGVKARRATRIDADRAQSIENAFARQVASAPERFKDQLPADGSKLALLRAIHDLQRIAPNDELIGQLAEDVRRRIAPLHAMLTAFGAVEFDLLSRRRARRLRHLRRQIRERSCGIPSATGSGRKHRGHGLPARRR